MDQESGEVYLRECLIENVGPLKLVDLSFPFNDDGSPKPIVLVGRNGSGKTILLSHIVDALIEFGKTAFNDVIAGQGNFHVPYFKIIGGSNQRTGTIFGIALLQFTDGDAIYCYVDKSGSLEPKDYQERASSRFSSVMNWPITGPHKKVDISEEVARRAFKRSAICFFPAARRERPHWLNRETIKDEPLFYTANNLSDRLHKPVIVESASQENKQWLLDILLDSKVDIEPIVDSESSEVRFRITSNVSDYMLLQRSRTNVEAILRAVLQDEEARLRLNYRSLSPERLSIETADGTMIPSLDHLSSGQANLLNLFWTIIRYADRGDINKSHSLKDIEGIVLVDEIESQAHSDLQYEVIPTLIRMFPRVQFILTSHSPLFLLGMEQQFGSDGFRIVEMPNGQTITTERFSEFARSWEYYRRTAAYEQDVERALTSSSKPLVLTEGETDPKYIKTALQLLGRQDLLETLDIQWVGEPGSKGPAHSGVKGLDNTVKALRANPDLSNRRVLFLYDSDTGKFPQENGRIRIRSLPINSENTKMRRGIENLFSEGLFGERFYPEKTTTTDFGEQRIIQKFDKAGFCAWVCSERRNANDFEGFKCVVEILEDFLHSCSQ